MNTTAYILLLLTGIWLIGISIFIFARPKLALKYLKKFASTHFINFFELSLRMIAGLAFAVYAESSRYPKLFLIIGGFLVVSAAILFLTPRRLHAKFAVYWSNKLSTSNVRFAAPFSFLAGSFLIFAIH